MDMAPPPAEQETVAVETTQARLAYQQAVLRELTELGMRLTRALCDEVEAKGERPQPRTADPALMFSRLSRAIRLNLALETRLAEGGLVAQRPRAERAADPQGDPQGDPKAEAVERYHAQRQDQANRRQTVMVAVETLIDYDAPEDDIDRMLEDLERLADPADDARFADAPLSQWIAAICKDLGLPPNWTWLANAHWAAEEAVAWPDSPFAKLIRPDPPPGGARIGEGGSARSAETEGAHELRSG